LERTVNRRVRSHRTNDIIKGHRHMRLDPRLLANTSTNTRSGIFRLKALFSEQRARQVREPRSRSDWEELAIEWHAMANLATGTKTESTQIDVG
jgi:hypothetical protein